MSQTFTGGAVRFNGDYCHKNIYNSAVNVWDIHSWCSDIIVHNNIYNSAVNVPDIRWWCSKI